LSADFEELKSEGGETVTRIVERGDPQIIFLPGRHPLFTLLDENLPRPKEVWR